MVQFRVTLGAVETVHDTIENTKQQKQHNRFTRKKKASQQETPEAHSRTDEATKHQTASHKTTGPPNSKPPSSQTGKPTDHRRPNRRPQDVYCITIPS